ncbi:slipin family protein [archaeon]|jgi:regulator of protease activity HflC (stomatin/prohibitin superfamily)|nr:slipin family protein [archaeon]MBT4351777.1 slipin family protein [archaeon]MBT4648315.1 slipin family protein [archaeon]MBT6822304.1 slipin family protein [archaeon]MBT7391801.1 slipin family protein [archaeon]
MAMALILFLGFWAVIIILSGLRVIKQFETGILFTLGKFSKTLNPGLNFVLPIFQTMTKIDMRVTVVDVPEQDCISKDNVSINVNAVLYYKVAHAKAAILEVEEFHHATSQIAQTTMRDIVGEVTLDELLSNRDEISKRIQILVDQATDPWGIKITSVDLKHVELPGEMKRVMAKAAEAERERRAVIIKADGEAVASTNLAKAALVLAKTPGALHLRTLQSLNDISSDQSNTLVFAIPLEILRAFESISRKK